MKKKNARINLSVQEIFLLSDECASSLFARQQADESFNRFLNEVIAEIQKSMAALFRFAEAIAMLDMLAAFVSLQSLCETRLISEERQIRERFFSIRLCSTGMD